MLVAADASPKVDNKSNEVGWLAAKCQMAGMRISTTKLKLGLSVRKWQISLIVSEKNCPKWRRPLGILSEVTRCHIAPVYQGKALHILLLISLLVHVPTLYNGHDLWVMTKRMTSQIQVSKMSFLHCD